jgi:kinesin family protein 6/9
MRLPKDETAGHVNNQQETWHFKLDKVLSNASQEQVFECCAQDVVRSVMEGYNGTILAYGQTGAGKTHTMTGGHVGFADRGIVPRAISLIFSEAAARPESSITVRLSYLEIYNELMFDLLRDVAVSDQSGDITIVEDSRGNIQARGLSASVASSEEEALHVFFQGDTNRHVAEHALNKGSTRSHVVFTIHVESRSRVESSEKVIYSKLHLVDLAGSERVKKTGSDGVILHEATHINKSLTFLEQVVVALGNKHRDHVPYRQSKLTHLLKDSLGGNCKTTMVANVWPEAKMLQETASTLRFATRMMRVSNEASVNVHLDPQLLIRKYERQIKDLKQELAMHDTLAGRSRVQYEEYTPDEARELEEKVKMYVDGELQEIEVSSLRMVYEAFGCFRKLYQQLGTELASRPAAASQQGQGAAQVPDGGLAAQQGHESAREGEVGEDEEGRGISVGLAPADSRPAAEDRSGVPAGEPGDGGRMLGSLSDASVQKTRSLARGEDEPRPDKQSAFADWKAHEGQAFEEDFEKNRAELRERKEEMRVALTTANAKKREIDEAKERLDRKQADKAMDPSGRDEELIDEEEYALIKSLKETKLQYREAFETHKRVRTEVMQVERSIQQCKSKLVQAFEEWYDLQHGQAQRAKAAESQGERFDSQEMFDLMEAGRIETQHPDALAFHNARKNAARDVRQKKAVPARVGR